MLCVYLLESPHRGNSNEYTQHTIRIASVENCRLIIAWRHD